MFVFTGQMAFGPRRECERHVELLGGACENTITKRTTHLVIGTFGSRDWAHTSFGRKMEKAVQLRDIVKTGLVIVGEDHWAGQLPVHVAGPIVVRT